MDEVFESMTDSQLCEASAKRQKGAFVELVRRYHQAVCAVTYAATGRREVSEDLAQETFLAAWKGIGRVEEPKRVGRWLTTIARNLGRRFHRRPPAEPLLEGSLAAQDATLEDAIVDHERQAHVWRLLDGLPESYREAMVLYYREGESASRVAEVLDISTAAAQQRLSRGRKLLRDRVERELARELVRTRPSVAFTRRVAAALPILPAVVPGESATATAGTSARALHAIAANKVVAATLLVLAVVVGAWGLLEHLDDVPATATRPSHGAADTAEALSHATAADDVDVAENSIAGTLLDAIDGRALSGGVVTVTGAEGRVVVVRTPGQPPSLAVALVDVDGRWNQRGLAAGRYTLTATSPGYLPSQHGVVVSEAGVADELTLSLRPGGHALRGVVRDAGGGSVEGAVVSATARTGAAYSAHSDADGNYELSLPNERFVVVAWDADYHRDEHQVTVQGAGRIVDFELTPAASIRGRVLDRATGSPVAGAAVSCMSMVRSAGGFAMGDCPSIETDSLGRFAFGQLGVGSYQLFATADHRATIAPPELNLGIADDVADVTVYVDPAFNIRGRVVDAEAPARGVPDVEIQGALIGQWRTVQARSGPDGWFELQGIVDGSVMVTAHGGGIIPTGFDHNERVAGADVRDVVIAVRRGVTIVGRTHPPAVADIQLDVGERTDPEIARRDRLEVHGLRTQSAPDGSFTLAGVPAGDWTVVASAGDGSQGETAVSVDADGATGVVVERTARPTLGGVVVDAMGEPMADVTVTLAAEATGPGASSLSGAASPSAVTDTAGAFALVGLTEGRYAWTVRARGGALLTVADQPGGTTPTIEVPSDGRDQVRLVVERFTGVVSGVLRRPDGEPHPDGWVALRGPDDGVAAIERPAQVTGSDGAFSFEGLPPLKYRLSAWSARGDATVNASEVTTGGETELVLTPRGAIRGQVSTVDGEPVTRFYVRSARLFNRMFISPDGAFDVDAVAPGTSLVEISAPEGTASVRLEVASGSPTTANIELQPWGTISGRIVSVDGDPMPDLTLAIQRKAAGNLLFGASGFRATGQGVRTDADGRFSVDRVVPGDGRLAFNHGEWMAGVSAGAVSFVAESGADVDLGEIVAVSSRTVDPAKRGTLGLRVDGTRSDSDGLWIRDVVADGPAARADVQPGWRLVSIQDRAVAELGAETAALLVQSDRVERGQVYTLTVETEGGEQDVTLLAAPVR